MKNSSPMNCSLILEEYIRENKDLKRDTFVAFLDAKAAFNVINHSSLMTKFSYWCRRCYMESNTQSTQGRPDSDTMVWSNVRAIRDTARCASGRGAQYRSV